MAARGGVQTVAGQLGRMTIQLASLTVLARLISPYEYGLAAMVMSISAVALVVSDFGLSFAATQARELSVGQRNKLFWISTSLGLALGISLYLGAEILAEFYGQPEVEDIARVLSITFILSGASAQYRADHLRKLKFGRLALIDVMAQLLAFVTALTLAIDGAGYWALVASTLTMSGISLLALAFSARWVPGMPWSKGRLSQLLRFGGVTMLTQLINNISSNVNPVAIGRLISPEAVGIYTRGHQIFALSIQQLAGPLTAVAVPVLSKLQDEPIKFEAYAKRAQSILCYVVGFALCLVAVGGAPLVTIILGPKWSDAGVLVQILAAGGAFQIMGYVNYWMFLARGNMSVLLLWEGVARIVMIPLIVFGTSYGLVYSAAAYSLGLGLVWFCSTAFGLPQAGLSARVFMINGAGPMTAFFLVYCLSAIMRDALYDPHLDSFGTVAASMATALALSSLFMLSKAIRSDVMSVFRIVTEAMSKAGR